MNEAAIAANIAALFSYETESFEVGPFKVALGEYYGEERVRICGERGDPNGVGSHTVCAEGEDYDRAARYLINSAEAHAAALARQAA